MKIYHHLEFIFESALMVMGDVARVENCLFIGLSTRTNLKGFRQLEQDTNGVILDRWRLDLPRFGILIPGSSGSMR